MSLKIITIILIFVSSVVSFSLNAQDVPKTKAQKQAETMKPKATDEVLSAEERVQQMINNSAVTAKGKAKGQEVEATSVDVSNTKQLNDGQQKINSKNPLHHQKHPDADKNAISTHANSTTTVDVTNQSTADLGETATLKVLKQNELNSAIKNGMDKIAIAKNKLTEARSVLEQEKDNMSDGELQQRQATLDAVQEQINTLEKHIVHGQNLID